MATGTADLAARARADGVRFLLVLFVDLTGEQRAKLDPDSPGRAARSGAGVLRSRLAAVPALRAVR